MFGLFTPIVQPINLKEWEDRADVDDLAQVVITAESVGFDFVTVGDHGALAADEQAYYGNARFYDPLATIGFLAALTRRIRFATHVYQLPLRSPLITAKAFATLDVLSKGRVIAGFGVGSRPYEARAARVPFTRRGAVADDYLRAVLALWSGEPTTMSSRFTDIAELVCRPAPVQRPRPPVWIGGDRYVALRRALALGDGWAPWALTPEQASQMLAQATSERNAPLPDGFRVILPLAPLGGRAPRGSPAPPPAKPGPAAAASCLEAVGHWRSAGVTDFVIDLPSAGPTELAEAMEWFATEVLSRTDRNPSRPTGAPRASRTP